MRREVEVLRLEKLNQCYLNRIEKYVQKKYGIVLSDTVNYEDEQFLRDVISNIFKNSFDEISITKKYPIQKFSEMDEDFIETINLYLEISQYHGEDGLIKEECIINKICESIKEHIYVTLMNFPYVLGGWLKTIYVLCGYSMYSWGNNYDKNRKGLAESALKYIPWEYNEYECKCTYIEKIEDTLFKEAYVTIFDCFKDMNGIKKGEETRDDITRYGYEILVNIINEIKEDDEKYTLKNMIILDELLGITLTNVIFNYVSDCESEKLNAIYDIAEILGEINSVDARNWLADVVFGYLFHSRFDKRILKYVSSVLLENVDAINSYLSDLESVLIWDFCNRRLVGSYASECFEEVYNYCGKSWNEEIYLKTIEIANVKPDIVNTKKRQRIAVTRHKESYKERYAAIHCHVMRGIWKKGMRKEKN